MINRVVTPGEVQGRHMSAPGNCAQALSIAQQSLTAAIKATTDEVQEQGDIPLGIGKRSDPAEGLQLLAKRQIVAHTDGGLGRCRRLTKDHASPTM